MNSLLKLLKQKFIQDAYLEEEQRLDENLIQLKSSLTKEQRLLLRNIIDDKDLIREQTMYDQFARGFKQGVEMMIVCLYQSKEQ